MPTPNSIRLHIQTILRYLFLQPFSYQDKMKLTFFIVAFVGTCRAQLAPVSIANVPSDLIRLYKQLYKDCVAKGGNTVSPQFTTH